MKQQSCWKSLLPERHHYMPTAAASACINKTVLLSYLLNARNPGPTQDAFVIIQRSC